MERDGGKGLRYSPAVYLVLILALSLLIRLVIIIAAGDIPLFGDEFSYNRLAINLSQGLGFKLVDSGSLAATSYRAPLHPYVLAGLYSILGENHIAARILQSGFMVAAAFVFYLLGKMLFGVRAGLLTAALVAFDPLLIAFGTWLWAEPLYILLAAIAFYCLLRFSLHAGRLWLLPAGLFWGLATLTRESGQLLAFFIAIWLLWVAWLQAPPRRVESRRLLRLLHATLPALLFLAMAAIVIAPWTYRNYLVHKAFVPVTTVSGLALWLGNNPWQDWSVVFQRYGEPATEIARERLAFAEATAYILDSQPLWLPRKVLLNWPKLLSAENFLLRHLRQGIYGSVSVGFYNAVFAVTTIYYGIVGSAAVVGMWLSPKKEGSLVPGRILCLLPIGAFLLGHTVLHAHSRHRVAILPFLALFAAWSWTSRKRLPALLRRGWPAAGAWASLLIFLVLLLAFRNPVTLWLRSLMP